MQVPTKWSNWLQPSRQPQECSNGAVTADSTGRASILKHYTWLHRTCSLKLIVLVWSLQLVVRPSPQWVRTISGGGQLSHPSLVFAIISNLQSYQLRQELFMRRCAISDRRSRVKHRHNIHSIQLKHPLTYMSTLIAQSYIFSRFNHKDKDHK